MRAGGGSALAIEAGPAHTAAAVLVSGRTHTTLFSTSLLRIVHGTSIDCAVSLAPNTRPKRPKSRSPTHPVAPCPLSEPNGWRTSRLLGP